VLQRLHDHAVDRLGIRRSPATQPCRPAGEDLARLVHDRMVGGCELVSNPVCGWVPCLAMTTLADRLPPNALWQRLQPLLQLPPSHARGGAPRTVPDRACMAAIIFMVRTSTPWALLPVGEFGHGSVTTCWRRFAGWAHAGCSSGSRRSCWTNSARPARWTGRGSAWTPSACARSGGTTLAQTRSTGPSPDPSCTWRLTAVGCRCRSW
jgi:transposase